jgi:hypothetical protein
MELCDLAAWQQFFLSGEAAWQIAADGKCASLAVLLIGFMVWRQFGSGVVFLYRWPRIYRPGAEVVSRMFGALSS